MLLKPQIKPSALLVLMISGMLAFVMYTLVDFDQDDFIPMDIPVNHHTTTSDQMLRSCLLVVLPSNVLPFDITELTDLRSEIKLIALVPTPEDTDTKALFLQKGFDEVMVMPRIFEQFNEGFDNAYLVDARGHIRYHFSGSLAKHTKRLCTLMNKMASEQGYES